MSSSEIMSPDQWFKVKAVVQEALEMEPGERARFIAVQGRTPASRAGMAALMDALAGGTVRRGAAARLPARRRARECFTGRRT